MNQDQKYLQNQNIQRRYGEQGMLSPYSGQGSVNNSQANQDYNSKMTDSVMSNTKSRSIAQENQENSLNSQIKTRFEVNTTRKQANHDNYQHDEMLNSPLQRYQQNSLQINHSISQSPLNNSQNQKSSNQDYMQKSIEMQRKNNSHNLQPPQQQKINFSNSPSNNNLQVQFDNISKFSQEDPKDKQIIPSIILNNNSPSATALNTDFKAYKKSHSKNASFDYQSPQNNYEQKSEQEIVEPIKSLSKFGKIASSNNLNFEQKHETQFKQSPSNNKQVYDQANMKKNVHFVQDFEYFYFDPKFKVKDLNQEEASINQEDISQKKEPKKILKIKELSITNNKNETNRTQKRERKLIKQESSNQIANNDIRSQKSIPNQSDSSISDIEEIKDEDNLKKSNTITGLSSLLKNNLRERSGVILPNTGIVHKNQVNAKYCKLNEYEKVKYMSRSSDISKLIEFQNRNVNKLSKYTFKLIKILYEIILRLLTLSVFKPQISQSKCWISFSASQLQILYFNLSFIGSLVFLYSIIELYINQNNEFEFKSKIFLSSQGIVTYSGHFFIFIFLLGLIKLAKQTKNFSVNDKEKQGFKLVFSNYRWDRNINQLKGLAKKGRWIDQIYENIDIYESYELSKHILIIWIFQIILFIINLIALYFILDDSYLLQLLEVNVSSFSFINRLIVAGATSILILINSYLIHVQYMFFKQVEFTFYEQAKIYQLFFNQMIILVIYQIKIMAYLNSEYEPGFLNLKLTDSHELSYVNFALIISELIIQSIERLIVILVKAHISQLPLKKNNTMIQVVPIINNNSNEVYVQAYNVSQIGQLKESILLNQTPKITQIVQTDEDIDKKEEIKNEFSEINTKQSNINQGDQKQQKQNLIVNSKNFTTFSSSLKSPNVNQALMQINKDRRIHIQFRLTKNSIFIISINYLIISNVILQPSIMIVGLAINIFLQIILFYEIKMQQSFITLLDYSKYDTIINLISSIALLCCFFFNFVVGFNVNSLNNNHYSLFEDEFSYLFDIKKVNEIFKIITLPYLLFPIIILLSIILYQTKQYQKRNDIILRDCYYKLKNTQNKKEQ